MLGQEAPPEVKKTRQRRTPKERIALLDARIKGHEEDIAKLREKRRAIVESAKRRAKLYTEGIEDELRD
jgi:F0F1-type ATP synthase membrane subunit b/b'